MNALYRNEKRLYQIDNIAYHCFHAQLPERLDSLISKKWLNIRSGDIEDYSGFLRDLDLSWALTQNDSKLNIPSLVRYSMINSTINTIAKGIPPALYPIFINNQIWGFEGAIALADQFVDPWKRNEAFLRICFQSNITELELERAFNKALDIKFSQVGNGDIVKASFLSLAVKYIFNKERFIDLAIVHVQGIENLYFRQAVLACIAEASTIRRSEILEHSIKILHTLEGVEKIHGKANLSFCMNLKEFEGLFDNLYSLKSNYDISESQKNWKMRSLYNEIEITILKKVIPYLPVELYANARELISRIVEKNEDKIELYLLMADPYKHLYLSQSQFLFPLEEVQATRNIPPIEEETLIRCAMDIATKSKEEDSYNYFGNIIEFSSFKKELQSEVIKGLPNNIQVSGRIMNSRFFRNLKPEHFEDMVDLIIRYPKELRPPISSLLTRLPSHLIIKLIQNIDSFDNKMESFGFLIPFLPRHLQYSWATLAYNLSKMPENKELRDKTVYIYSADKIINNDIPQHIGEGNNTTASNKKLFFNQALNFIKYNKNSANQLYVLFTFEQKLKLLNKSQINQIWELYKSQLEPESQGEPGSHGGPKISYLTSIFIKYLSPQNRNALATLIFDRLIKIPLNADPTLNENISFLCAFADLISCKDKDDAELLITLSQKIENPKVAECIQVINSAILSQITPQTNPDKRTEDINTLLFSSEIDEFSLAWVIVSLLPHVCFTRKMLPYIERAIANPSWGELKESFAAIRAFNFLPVDICLELMPILISSYIKDPLRIICENVLYSRLFSTEITNQRSLQTLYGYLSGLDREVWFQNIISLAPFLKKFRGQNVADQVGRTVLDVYSWWQPRSMY